MTSMCVCGVAAGQNDTPEVAHKLGKLLSKLNKSCHVNLIPLNPTAGFDGAPTKAAGKSCLSHVACRV
jgi:adenine C2-methylase RlmN of 23S rRNA A2503 and tRNA A37